MPQKSFIKLCEASQRSVKVNIFKLIFILLQLYEIPGAGKANDENDIMGNTGPKTVALYEKRCTHQN